MCHQMHVESEECCLKFCLYTVKLIVPVPLLAPLELRCIINEKDTLLLMVAHRHNHMTVLDTENIAP